MTKSKEICLTRYSPSGIGGAFNRGVRKTISINCHSLLQLSHEEFVELYKRCTQSNVILSMDLSNFKPCAFDVFSQIKSESAGYYFLQITNLLSGCYSVTMPYFEEEGRDCGVKLGFSRAKINSPSFQLSRALLQYFLTKGYHLDNKEIYKKHKHSLHNPLQAPAIVGDKVYTPEQYLPQNVAINDSHDYFSNTIEALACLDTYKRLHRKDDFKAIYLGLDAHAFPLPGDLTAFLKELIKLPTIDNVRARKEWVLILRGEEYKNTEARDVVYQEVRAAIREEPDFGLLHLFLLTKNINNPVANAYPDFSVRKISDNWTPLLDESGYYLSNRMIFMHSIMLQGSRRELDSSLRMFLLKPVNEPTPILTKNAKCDEVYIPAENDASDTAPVAPYINYVIQSTINSDEVQGVQAQADVQASENQNQTQQQLTTVQVQSKSTLNRHTNSLFGMGVFHFDFNAFVSVLTDSLTKLVAQQQAIRDKFKLYYANSENSNDLWGLGAPSVAAKKIASKVYGVKYQDEGNIIIKTRNSLQYIDTAYNTASQIIRRIEYYLDGYCFIKPDSDNDSYASMYNPLMPMHIKGKQELVVAQPYHNPHFDIKSDLFFTFTPSDLLSTLPVEIDSVAAKKAYYYAFDGKILSNKDRDYSHRLMAVFLSDLPISTIEEQDACLDDYCALYREYDDSVQGEANIRSLLQKNTFFKASLKRLLYVHIKGGSFYVSVMIELLEKLEAKGLLNLFYKLYFEKSTYIFSLFTFMHEKNTKLDFAACANVFLSLPSKKDWLPKHEFLASYLLSFVQTTIVDSTISDKFWSQIEALVFEYANGANELQQKTLALIAKNLAGEDGLRVKGGCQPDIVFRTILKILSSAGNNLTFNEQIEMLSDLPMAWCDALSAIENEDFRVVCREMKLETAYLNPISPGSKLSNGYTVTRADFEKALAHPPSFDAPISLETLLFRYLGIEVSRQSLSYYRLLFKSAESFQNKLLGQRVISLIGFYTSGVFYTNAGKFNDRDIEQHFTNEEQVALRPLLNQLHDITVSSEFHDIEERYQLKSLLEQVPNPIYEALSPEVKDCLFLVFDKKHLRAYLHSNQKLLKNGGVEFGWIALAFIEEALNEEAFFSENPTFKGKQRRLLQTIFPSFDLEEWYLSRDLIQSLVKSQTIFLNFFTKHASYKPEQADVLYQGLMNLSDNYVALQTLTSVLLECQHEGGVDFSELELFFSSLSEANILLKTNKAFLSRLAALILRAAPPSSSEAIWYARLSMHLIPCGLENPISLFNSIIKISESEHIDATAWLALSCELTPKLLTEAVKLFELTNDHVDTLPFLQKLLDSGQLDVLEAWIGKLELAAPNQRVFIFEIIYALQQKNVHLDWVEWAQNLRDLSLSELSALAKLSREAGSSVQHIKDLIQSHSIIETKNNLEREQLRLNPISADVFAPRTHTLTKITEISYKASSGHQALGLEHREQLALWQDYLTLQALVLDPNQPIYVEQSPNGHRQVRSMQELTEAEIQTSIERIRLELADATTPSFRKHDLELQLIALASVAIYRVTRRFPRDVQLLALLNSMNRPQHVIHEIATGEGKGITTALHAVLVWARGDIADVATINDKLAERDRKQFNPVYQYLGIPCSDAIITPETSPESCQKHGIYYGIWSSFSLLDTNIGVDKGLARPYCRSLICDEVDATINTTVEARLATSIDPMFQGKKKWENLYNYLLDFVIESPPPRSLASCKDYLVMRNAADKLKDPAMPPLPLLKDKLLGELLRAAILANSYREKVDFSIVEKSITKNRKTKIYLYAAPILDSTKSPEASISWQWVQQLLHTKLNRRENLSSRFKIDRHDETVMTVSAGNFINNYQKRGGKVYALTGTAGSSPDVQRFFEENKCVSFAHPRFAPNRRQDHGIIGSVGKEAHFALLFANLKQLSKDYRDPSIGSLPFLTVFSSAKEVEEFYQYVQVQDREFAENIQCYDGIDKGGRNGIESYIKKADKPNVITLTTESLARGADVDAKHWQGLFTINTCTELTDNDFLQILGRSGRAGHTGHTLNILDLSRLIPQEQGETLDEWFSRHREDVALKQSEQRKIRKPLQDIRYAVTSRLLDLKVELTSILQPQEGAFSSDVCNKQFLKELNKLDELIEAEYYRLVKLKDPMVDNKLMEFAVDLYEKSLQLVLSGYQLDDYSALELQIPLNVIPQMIPLNTVPLRDLSLLSDALSILWTFAGNKAVSQGFEMANKGMRHLDAYFKKESSLQSLLFSQMLNMNFVTKEICIEQIEEVQAELAGWLRSISDFKILGHSMLINEKEAEEIENELNEYLNGIKIAIQNEQWDEIQPPNPKEGVFKKYIDKLKGLTPGADGKGNTMLRAVIKYAVKPSIKKQDISKEEKDQQLALLSMVEALMMSVASASKNSYSLDTPIGLFLENIENLFTNQINEVAKQKDKPDMVKGFLSFLEENNNQDKLQTIFLGYFVQALPALFALLNTEAEAPAHPDSNEPHPGARSYSELSVREFFSPNILFSFLIKLTKLPEFLKIFADHKDILVQINRISEIPLSSFEKISQLTLADDQLLHAIQLLAHPNFKDFLIALPKDVNWETMSTWLQLEGEAAAALPEPIHTAIKTLKAHEEKRVESQIVSVAKIRTLRTRFTLSLDTLTNEIQALRAVPPVPEMLNSEPLALDVDTKPLVLAPALHGIKPGVAGEIAQVNLAPVFPPIHAWVKKDTRPQAFLLDSMQHIAQTGEIKPKIEAAIAQVAFVIKDTKMPIGERFYCIENTLEAIKQWQLIDGKDPVKSDYLSILKPALFDCMKGYRSGLGKNLDRYKLIRELIKKANTEESSECFLELLLKTKQKLLKQDRKADESFIHSILGWRRNSNGRSRLLDHLDNMIAGVTIVMVAEGKIKNAEARIEKGNLSMLGVILQRKKIDAEFKKDMKVIIAKDPKASYHAPLLEVMHHLKNNSIFAQKKHLSTCLVSFDKVESFRQKM